MNKAKTLIFEAQQLFQYSKHGNSSAPIGHSEKVLDPGVYKIDVNMGQAIFTKNEIKSDQLINLRNKKRQEILAEFKNFWSPEVKGKFERLGLIHKRGFIYEGPPGTGKSCDMKWIMGEMVASGDIIFIAESARILVECLKQFKEVEPDRHVAVVMEDFERMADYGEHDLLELLDGPNAVGGVFYLATTNFINRVSERLKRKSRFDRIIHVGYPEYEDRLEYFKNKLENLDTFENIRVLANRTSGRSFADMKDMIVAIYCLGNSLEEVLLEMNNGNLKEHHFSESQLNTKLKKSGKGLNEGLSMSSKSRALKFLELFGSIDRKELSDRDVATSRDGTNKEQHDMANYVAPPHQSGNMPDNKDIYDENGPIDDKRVIQNLTQRLKLLNIRGISVDGVESDEEGSIFVTFSDNEGNEMEAEFGYDDNDQMSIFVNDSENPIGIGGSLPGAVTTAYGKYVNLYDAGVLDKETLLNIFAQGGIYPTKDRTVNMGKDAFGNRLPISTG